MYNFRPLRLHLKAQFLTRFVSVPWGSCSDFQTEAILKTRGSLGEGVQPLHTGRWFRKRKEEKRGGPGNDLTDALLSPLKG